MGKSPDFTFVIKGEPQPEPEVAKPVVPPKPSNDEVELFIGQNPVTMKLVVGDKAKAMGSYRTRTNTTLSEATEAFIRAIYSSVCRQER